MGDDTPLKSAYELAMERLRSRDREEGIEHRAPLSERAKHEIAKLRAGAKAKLAEIEIFGDKEIAAAGGDPDKLRELEEHRKIDRRRVEEARDSAIERVKRKDRD